MQKLISVQKRAFGRINFFKKSGARLYIPQKIISDPDFPFANGDVIKIEIREGELRLKSAEWWEMLDWETMPDTFAKLPKDVQDKIRGSQ
jgi:hypothetical protein